MNKYNTVINRKCFQYYLTGLLMALLCTPALAQKKYEREYDIKPEAVPERAMKFISSVFKNSRVRWYGEESLTDRSIEAKLKDSGKQYSIEFDVSGQIQDIEIRIKMNQIHEKARTLLKDNLSRVFTRYKVTKTQLQWKGNENALKQALLSDKLPEGVETRYELVLRATKDKKAGYYEVLCESNGAIVRISEIVQRNADNLIY